MSRPTRDGTAEPVSRDQILRHARGQGNIIFPVQLTTSKIGNLTRLIHTLLYVMAIHTYSWYEVGMLKVPAVPYTAFNKKLRKYVQVRESTSKTLSFVKKGDRGDTISLALYYTILHSTLDY